MRIGLTILLALHGAIHLMGFLKWSKLADVPQLSDRTIVPLAATSGLLFALFWLLACLLFLSGAGMRVARSDLWWIPTVIAVVLSQGLIVLCWHDAKFGTLANFLISVPIIITIASVHFNGRVEAEIRSMLRKSEYAQHPMDSTPIRREQLQHLPKPVRGWLEHCGVIGKKRAQTVRLKQRGDLRTSPTGAKIPAVAEQYFSIEPPAFVWRVDATMMGFFPIAGRDKYHDGTGHMLIKAASMITIANQADEKIAHGALLRFLGEMVWFPSAALSQSIAWDPVDSTRAKATIRHAGISASGVFTFSEKGQVLSLQAERYLGGGKDARLTPWQVSISKWRIVRDIEIPVEGDVSWQLSSGKFTYFLWEIVDVEYDQATLYGDGTAHAGG